MRLIEILREVRRPDIDGLNDAVTRCHAASVAAGWWSDLKTGEPIQRNKGELLMLIVSEIAEAMEAERKNLMDDKLPHRRGADPLELKPGMLRKDGLLALQWRERTSDVPTRYRTAWSVFRFVEFPDNSPASIEAACAACLPGKGLVTSWLPDGAQFHFALVGSVAEDVTKRRAMAALNIQS